MINNNGIIRLGVGVQLLILSTAASGYEFDAAVRAGVGVSDNIGRVPQNEIDETIATVGFDFGVIEESRKMDLNIRSNFDYVNYTDGTFESEVVGGLNGSAVFTLIDERLTWVFEDRFGQALQDPLRASQPGNREDVNVFSTGPTLSILAASRNPINIDLRYSSVDYEIRPYNNDRLTAAIDIGREISRVSTVSLNLDATRIEYGNDVVIPPVERYRVYARFETTGNLSTFGFDLGYNEVEYGGIDGDGLLARLDYTRETSANGLFSVAIGSQYSDQGNIFSAIRDRTYDLGDTADITDSPIPFQNNYVLVSYSLDRERYSVDVLVDWNQEDYFDDLGNDRDLFRGELRFRREITRKVFAGATIRATRREYESITRSDDELTMGVNIGYRFSAGLDIRFDYQHFQRNSETPGADYTENRAFVRLTYIPLWSR